jgi:aryl-alcohol dehydrogenase-like predicted oxidoreductase
MRYKLLGKSGLRVSELCLGAMTFGEAWDIGASYETCKKVFDTFAEAGGN